MNSSRPDNDRPTNQRMDEPPSSGSWKTRPRPTDETRNNRSGPNLNDDWRTREKQRLNRFCIFLNLICFLSLTINFSWRANESDDENERSSANNRQTSGNRE